MPPAQHLSIPPPSPFHYLMSSTLPARSGHFTPYWPCHFPATTIPSINTPHKLNRVILHSLPYEDGTDKVFGNVGF